MAEAIAGLLAGILIGWVLRGVVVRWRWSNRSALRHSSSMPPPLPTAAPPGGWRADDIGESESERPT